MAGIHTHAAFDSCCQVGNNDFSPTDINNMKGKSYLSYLVTPRGYVRRYDPSDESNIVVYKDVPYDPKYPRR